MENLAVQLFKRDILLIASEVKYVPLDEIIDAVSVEFKVARRELLGRMRYGYVCRARHAVYWLARRYCRLSVNQTAIRIGRDHTTLLKCEKRFCKTLERDKELRSRISSVERYLGVK